MALYRVCTVRFYLYIFYSRDVLEVRLCSTSVSNGPTAHPVDYSGKSSIVRINVLFVCKCVLYYCHLVTTQLQLPNISCQKLVGEVEILKEKHVPVSLCPAGIPCRHHWE